jgi:hypothetical protein
MAQGRLATDILNNGEDQPTMDTYFILLTLAFFALTGGMVYLFDHL